MSRNKRTWLWLGALVIAGCTEETLSLGETRCEGEGVVCGAPPDIDVEYRFAELEAEEEHDAEITWQAELPCPDAFCAHTAFRTAGHADGSISIARVVGSAQRDGVALARFGADGELLWHNESLLRPHDPEGSSFEAALAIDGDGQLLFAEVTHERAASTIAFYSIDDAGELELLFRTEGPDGLGGIGAADRDVVFSGAYALGSGDEAARAEVARYDREGNLIWRQTGLRQSDGRELSPDEVGIDVAADMPTVIDLEGKTWLIVMEGLGFGGLEYSTVQVGPDGNLRWAEPFLSPDGFTTLTFAANVERAVTSDNLYDLVQIAPAGNPPEPLDVVNAFRPRDDYWEPFVFGLDMDAEGRTLVATVAGPLDEPRALIDRLDRDMTHRETFNVPALTAYTIPSLGALSGEAQLLRGIRASGEDAVYFWTDREVGRIDLP